MNVTHFKTSTFTVQTARSQCTQTTFVRQLGQGVLLVDHLRQFAAAKEEVDAARNALAVDQVGHFRDFFRVFQAHSFLHRAAELQEALSHFVGGQFVDRTKTTVTEVVDIIDRALAITQTKHVLHRVDEVFCSDRHFVFADVLAELAVDAESTHTSETVTIFVVEFFFEQGASLFQLRRVARTQACVNSQQGVFVASRRVFADRVQHERVSGLVDRFDLALGRRDDLCQRVAHLSARGDQLFARFRVDVCFDHVHLGAKLLSRHLLRIVEGSQELRRLAKFRIHRAEEHRGGDFAGLIDPHLDRVLFRHGEFDPATTLGNDPGSVERAVRLLHLDGEVDTGRPVQLRNDDALGTVDDELAATDHDRHFTKVNALFEHFLLVFPFQRAEHAEGKPIGEAKIATFLGFVAGFVQLIGDVVQNHRFVVTDDGEYFL